MRFRRHAAAAVTLAALGCSQITGDFSRVIAIEVSGTGARTVEEGDTTTLLATALDASGDPVPDAMIVWAVLDTGQVGFTLDSLSGLVTGSFPSSARVQARFEALRSGPITVTVTPAPDSLAPGGDAVVSVASGSDVSPSLQVLVFDLTTTPGTPVGLAGRDVTYSLPGGPLANVFLSVGEPLPVGDGSTIVAVTGGSGAAAAVLRRTSGSTAPDTVVVEARATTRTGAALPGSPVTFMVLFPN